jgi:hypothetical protein
MAPSVAPTAVSELRFGHIPIHSAVSASAVFPSLPTPLSALLGARVACLQGSGIIGGAYPWRRDPVTTFENRPSTALLVIDVQSGVVARAHRRDGVVANIGSLVEKARRSGVPVVWVQHSDEELAHGSDEWRIVPELTPSDDEPLVEKHYGDSFEGTSLEGVLSALGVGRLVVAGAQTDACIRSTLHGAFVRGYDTILVSDAHTTEDHTEWGAPPPEQVIAHTNLYWSYEAAPGREAGTIAADDVDFAPHPGSGDPATIAAESPTPHHARSGAT